MKFIMTIVQIAIMGITLRQENGINKRLLTWGLAKCGLDVEQVATNLYLAAVVSATEFFSVKKFMLNFKRKISNSSGRRSGRNNNRLQEQYLLDFETFINKNYSACKLLAERIGTTPTKELQ